VFHCSTPHISSSLYVVGPTKDLDWAYKEVRAINGYTRLPPSKLMILEPPRPRRGMNNCDRMKERQKKGEKLNK